jgi:hypothetical protein
MTIWIPNSAFSRPGIVPCRDIQVRVTSVTEIRAATFLLLIPLRLSMLLRVVSFFCCDFISKDETKTCCGNSAKLHKTYYVHGASLWKQRYELSKQSHKDIA